MSLVEEELVDWFIIAVAVDVTAFESLCVVERTLLLEWFVFSVIIKQLRACFHGQ